MNVSGNICSYYGCTSSRRKGDLMFRIPKKLERRLQWIKNIGGTALLNMPVENFDGKRVCEKHFDSTYIIRGVIRTRLHPNAVPEPCVLTDELNKHLVDLLDRKNEEFAEDVKPNINGDVFAACGIMTDVHIKEENSNIHIKQENDVFFQDSSTENITADPLCVTWMKCEEEINTKNEVIENPFRLMEESKAMVRRREGFAEMFFRGEYEVPGLYINGSVCYKCFLCACTYGTYDRLKHHIYSTHATGRIMTNGTTNQDPTFNVREKNLTIAQEKELAQDKNVGNREKNLRIAQEKELAQDKNVGNNLSRGKKIKRLTYQCDYCKRSLCRKKILVKHIMSQHFGENYMEPYPCTYCDKFFKSFRDVKLHTSETHRDVVCSLCKKQFECLFTLKGHMYFAHEEKYRCDQCGQTFMFKNSLKNHTFHSHFVAWRRPLPKCVYCNKVFTLYGIMRRHVKEIHGVRIYSRSRSKIDIAAISAECYYCKLRFNWCLMKYHVAYAHGDGNLKKPFKCTMCSFRTTRLSNIKFHIATIHNDRRRFVCDYCKMAFKIKPHLQNHIEGVHMRDRYKCDICNKTCTMAGLRNHINRHTDNKHKKRYQCKVCKRMYVTMTTFLNHFDRFHTKNWHKLPLKPKLVMSQRAQRPESSIIYICDHCKMCFWSKSGLRTHIQSIHLGTVPICKICNEQFKHYRTLQFHMLQKHDKARKLYICYHCGKRYLKKLSLKTHIEASHLNKWHVCDICKKGFAQKIQLATHTSVVHEKLKPHQCTFCKNHFATKSTLKIHTQSKHLGKIFKCEFCEKECSGPISLQCHIRAVHEKRKVRRKLYICYCCNKQFYVKKSFMSHLFNGKCVN